MSVYLLLVQEMLAMSLACMELQLEQWSHNKGKSGECLSAHWPSGLTWFAKKTAAVWPEGAAVWPEGGGAVPAVNTFLFA